MKLSSVVSVKRRSSSNLSISDLFHLFNFLVEGTILVELLCGHGRWAIPLDKGLLEEIPGIDSSWGESVHLSFCGSSESERKNSEHDCVFSDSENIK
ncbi:hypothetical protein Tco_1433107 [Tanacetum coccineum]